MPATQTDPNAAVIAMQVAERAMKQANFARNAARMGSDIGAMHAAREAADTAYKAYGVAYWAAKDACDAAGIRVNF